jgi:hypothetical protein
MRRSLAKFSESEASNHAPSLADFTTTTPELRFSVHTGNLLIEAQAYLRASIDRSTDFVGVGTTLNHLPAVDAPVIVERCDTPRSSAGLLCWLKLRAQWIRPTWL